MTKSKPDSGASVPADIKKMTFEESFKNLENIVNELEGGQAGLEDSIDIYARGVMLKRHCEQKLSAARDQIEMIVAGPGGSIDTEPAEID